MLFQVALFLEDFATNETLDGCCWIMDFANVPFQSTRLGKFRRTMGTGNSSSRLIMVELEKVILLVNKKSFNKRKKVPIYFPIMGNRCHSTLFSTSVTSSHMLFHRALFLEDFATKGTLDGAGADDVEHDDAVVADVVVVVVVVVGDEVVGAVAAVADPQPFPTWNEDDHQ
jgi:hypothetical protein